MDKHFLFDSTTYLPVPAGWTPQQALVVIDFLLSVIAAIESRYAADITRHDRREHIPDDDFPF